MPTAYDNHLDTDLCQITPMDTYRYTLGNNYEEGKNDMENVDNQNPVELTLSPEEAEKLLRELEQQGVAVTTDQAEPSEDERVIH